MAPKQAVTKESYADKLRKAMRTKAAEGGSNGNPLEFTPDLGTTRIRILPPVGEDFPKDPMNCSDSDMFYHTHKFHFIPDSVAELGTSKGRFMWIGKTLYDKDGKEHKNPIAEAVQQFYSVGRKENDEDLLKLGGALKLKRHFYANIIKYNEDGSFEYRTLVDKTNEGKLMKVICAAMGLPFFRDIDDNWVDANSTEYDEDQEFYDLLDLVSGYDFKIVKEKTGVNPWDISYEKSFVIKKAARALSDEELELMSQRVNLKTAVQHETSYEKVKGILDGLIGENTEDTSGTSEPTPVAKKPMPKTVPKTASAIKQAPAADDESLDKLLDELDEENE